MTPQRDQSGRFISTKVTVQENFKSAERAAEKAQFKNLGHAAASISKDAKQSIKKAAGPSSEGEPPHTHRGIYLRRGIRYSANKESAVIGPKASVVGASASAHEFGGKYKGTVFPERPFMKPALERAAPRFAGSWRGSIGE